MTQLTCMQYFCQLIFVLILSFIEIWILEIAWNQSIPYVFGLPVINFAQACFLYMVSSMLIYPKYNKTIPLICNDNEQEEHIV